MQPNKYILTKLYTAIPLTFPLTVQDDIRLCPNSFNITSHNSITVEVKLLSHVQLFGTPWTVAYQDPPSMGFSRQEYWSGLPFPSPRDLPNPGIEPGSPTL